MACPIHIWVPLMAAAVPAARVARTRLKIALEGRGRRTTDAPEAPPREVRRWAPIGSPSADEKAPSN